MPQFRKKPVVIDAIQWLRDNPWQLGEWRGQWPRDHPDFHICENGELEISTLEDGHDRRVKHVASPGDWIIRGIKGEFCACKPDIFEATYEPASSPLPSETPAEVVGELDDLMDEVAGEVVRAFGQGNPTSAKLRNDIKNAYLVALASPTFRHAVRRSLTKDGFPAPSHAL